MHTTFVVRRLRALRSERAPDSTRRSHFSSPLIALAAVAGLLLAPYAFGQASATASRLGDLQAGGGFTFGSSNYLRPALGGNGERLLGFNLYSSLDLRHHYGAEIDFRQTRPSYGESVYERTYEIGGRYVHPLGALRPYARAMYGRGVFNYPNGVANLAYNLVGLGGGADYELTSSVNLRLDYEYQHWFSFPLQALQPSLATVGVAYHFSAPGKCPDCVKRWR